MAAEKAHGSQGRAGGGWAAVRPGAEEGGMPSVLWAGPRGKGPLRLEVEVELEDFRYSLACGRVPQIPGEPHHFMLDPEVKEERAWILERKDRTASERSQL